LLPGLFALVHTGHAVSADAVMVGNATGQSPVVQGPVEASVDMTSCRFSMTLSQDQWLQFNSRDLVFVAAKQLPGPSSTPHFWQAQTLSGYEWNFDKSANLSQPWFGVMCENVGSFSTLTTQKPPSDETIELQLLRESNDRKCPATLTDHGWLPTPLAGDPKTYAFESLEGKSSGFIIGYHHKQQSQFSADGYAKCLAGQQAG
jgi:hypothetical protein